MSRRVVLFGSCLTLPVTPHTVIVSGRSKCPPVGSRYRTVTEPDVAGLTDRQAEREADRQAHRHTDRQTDAR